MQNILQTTTVHLSQLALLALSLSLPGASIALEAFNATYHLQFNHEIKGETQFNLLLKNNEYSFEAFTLPQGKLAALNSKHEVLETSHGQLLSGRPVPDTYYYAVRNISGTQMLELFFDWKKQQLTLRGDKNQQKFKLENGSQDRLSYILRAMMLANSHQREVRFKQVSIAGTEELILKKKLQKYISTPAGRFLALEISIQSSKTQSSRSLWLAVKKDFIPLVLTKHTAKGPVRMALTKLGKP
jgi:hypothetical protein